MRNFIFGVIFAGLFATVGVAAASTVTGGTSFDDVWTAIVDIRSDANATKSDLSTLKLQLTAKATQDALDKQAILDELDVLKKSRTVSVPGSSIAHSEHYTLGDTSFQGIQ
jgi:predicted XRE-type DNA-binding protein